MGPGAAHIINILINNSTSHEKQPFRPSNITMVQHPLRVERASLKKFELPLGMRFIVFFTVNI